VLTARECVHQIEQLLDAGQEVPKERVGELVWAYARACRELTAKADRCIGLLRQGRRNDAARLAKEPPDLEQEFRLLDFPQRQLWLDVCEAAAMPVAQALDTDALANIIREIYAESGPLDSLLKSFKRMNLARAPLADRLRMLRRIRQKDPQHEAWLEDLRAFESARLAELVRAAEDADTAGDLATLETVLQELQSGEWLAPPSRHAAAVEKIMGPHRRREAARLYDELLGHLRNAHASMYEPMCRSLMQQWAAVAERTGVGPNPSQAEGAAAVADWLEALDDERQEDAAYQAACAALEAALDDDKDGPALEQLAAAVFRFERGMPEVLAARFQTRMDELGRKARRGFALRLAAVVGAVLLAAGVVTLVFIMQSRHSEQARWQTQVSAALDGGDLPGAERMLQTLEGTNPAVRNSPEILALAGTLQTRLQEAKTRQAEIDGIRERIEAAGATSPDEAGLARAAELALTADEKQWVEKWRQAYQQAADAALRARDDAFTARLDELRGLYAAFVKAEQAKREDLDAAAAPALALAGELAGATDVSAALVSEASAIQKRMLQTMKNYQASSAQRQEAQALLVGFPAMCQKPEDLVLAMTDFVRRFPDHRLAADFAKAAAMGPQWAGTAAWQTMVSGWGGAVRVARPADCESRQQQVSAFMQQHAGCILEPHSRKYLGYLQAGAAACQNGQLTGLAKIKEALTHPIFTAGLVVVHSGDRAYYVLPNDLTPQRAGVQVLGYTMEYLTSASLAKSKASIAADKISSGPVQAPQSKFAQAALARIAAFGGAGWETFYLRMAASVQDDPDMDPILKGQLLRLMLDLAAQTTPLKQDVLKRHADQIANQNLDFVVWLDPLNAAAASARTRAAGVIQGLGSLKALADEVDKEVQALGTVLAAYRPVGVLMGEVGEVRCAQPAPDGPAYVLFGRGTSPATFQEIGTLQGGRLAGDPALTRPYPQGSIVFVRDGQPVASR
jgi:hypothetical protein